MEDKEKIELNKEIRKYEGKNPFIISLKKNLKSKYCDKVTVGKRSYKVLSEKQYNVFKNIKLD